MTTKKILLLATGICICFIIFTVFNSASGEQKHTEEVLAYWNEYGDFLKNGSDSPVTDKQSFKAPEFFAPNFAFKTTASISEIPTKEVITLATNTGESRNYKKFAKLSFPIGGKTYQLILLQNEEDKNDYFLPFKDLTNGKSSYGGGRYLEVNLTSMKKIELDFNLATNPYCAYNPDYSCPIPPSENFLALNINAGQKYFHE